MKLSHKNMEKVRKLRSQRRIANEKQIFMLYLRAISTPFISQSAPSRVFLSTPSILHLVNRFSTWLSSTFTCKWIECTGRKKSHFSCSHPVSPFFPLTFWLPFHTVSTYERLQDDLISDDIRQKIRHHYYNFSQKYYIF